MKIQCDVCNKVEATFFCVADEAALCESCDHRVHHANKLAGKHQRFSLLQPSSKEIPLCDICQEKRAFLFCHQDRAILCKDCDISIHKSNEHTQKHNRFLLTGVKLSSKSSLYSSFSSSCSSPGATASLVSSTDSQSNIGISDVPTFTPMNSTKKPFSVTSVPQMKQVTPTVDAVLPTQLQGYNGQLVSGSTSSISEYLIETLPGWHVEDFFDLSSTTTNGFPKTTENEIEAQQFWNNVENIKHSLPAENASLWVPQATPTTPILHDISPIRTYLSSRVSFGPRVGFKESKDLIDTKPNRKRKDENSFAVPQICPPSTGFRRSRTSW